MSASNKVYGPFLTLSSLLLAIPLALHGYFGLFSRYLADDFCTYGQYLSRGFFPSLGFWYLNWSGRYAFYFFINLSHALGAWLAPYLTVLTLLAWLALLYLLAQRFLRLLAAPQWNLPALLLALLVLLAVLEGAPDLYQSLYWHTGLVTYTLPLLFLTAYAAWLLHRVQSEPPTRWDWRSGLFSAALTMIAGGFSETYVAMQAAALLLCLAGVYFLAPPAARRAVAPVLFGGLAGALAALLLVSLAPGNTVRMGLMPDRLSLLEVAFWSLRHTAAFAAKAALYAPLTTLAALIIPGALALALFTDREAPPAPRSLLLTALGIPAAMLLLIVSTIVPSVYATAAYPAERALVTAQFILVGGLACWSLLLGVFLRSRLRFLTARPLLVWGLVILLLAAGAGLSAQHTLRSLPEAQSYAGQWDARDQALRRQASAGAQQIVAPSLPHISPGLAELSIDPTNWLNQCLALSYGLTSVVGK